MNEIESSIEGFSQAGKFPDPFTLILLAGALSLLPFVTLMTTSFIKIAVVLSLVRNALGVQQIPPNMALYGLSLILTIYIMTPVIAHVVDAVEEQSPKTVEDTFKVIKTGSEPFREFLSKHADPREVEFFLGSARRLWPENLSKDVHHDSFVVLIPSFMVSEITDAFKIGFLLYLPFIAIDLIISNLLLAMGMVMMSPMTISLPLKLFLFVMIDGWTTLIRGLILTYR